MSTTDHNLSQYELPTNRQGKSIHFLFRSGSACIIAEKPREEDADKFLEGLKVKPQTCPGLKI